MGWVKKGAVLLIGVALLGSGFFLFGVLCLGYVVVSSMRKTGGKTSGPMNPPSIQLRYIVAAVFAVLSLLALSSGGTLSPVVFFALAAAVFLWPHLPLGALASRAIPVEDTILLRSSLFPFAWHSVAELKPGLEDLPRALSSFEGRLFIARPGAVYTHIRVLAWDAKHAEEKVTGELGRILSSVSPGSAYLLPLDSKAASKAFQKRFSAIPSARGGLAGPFPDLLILDSSNGSISRSGAFSVSPGPAKGACFPTRTTPLRTSAVTWEALERLGKHLRWPGPDSFSNLLQSVHASRHEPISERLANLETSESGVTVQALGGDKVDLSRAQLRAILAIYSAPR